MKYKILFVFILAFAAVKYSAHAQFFKTQLKVTVLDEAGNIVEGAEVQLYANEDNWKKEENPVTDKLVTDKKGQVKFDELDNKAYFILVQKDDLNNWNGGIKTDELQPKRVNKINIIIE